MTIKQIGGVFGRNPVFNDVQAVTLEVFGTITSGGDLSANDADVTAIASAVFTDEAKAAYSASQGDV
jgi:hypothetical protein